MASVSARRIAGLHAVLAGAGLTTAALALAAALPAVRVTSVPTEVLLRACHSFMLPRLTVASVLALALGSVAFAALALGVRSTWRGLRAQRRLRNRLLSADAATGARLGVHVFVNEHPQAFCAGLLRPRIYLSTGALSALSTEELAAVLAHERHHARRRDPLRLLLAEVTSDALFFLPALRALSKHYGALAEIAADAEALRQTNSPTPLASALLAFEDGAAPGAIGIAPERVDHLLGKGPRWQLPVALIAWTLVLLGVILAVAVRTASMGTPDVNLPLVAAQLCMIAMAAAPLALGGAAVLGARRARLRRAGSRSQRSPHSG